MWLVQRERGEGVRWVDFPGAAARRRKREERRRRQRAQTARSAAATAAGDGDGHEGVVREGDKNGNRDGTGGGFGEALRRTRPALVRFQRLGLAYAPLAARELLLRKHSEALTLSPTVDVEHGHRARLQCVSMDRADAQFFVVGAMDGSISLFDTDKLARRNEAEEEIDQQQQQQQQRGSNEGSGLFAAAAPLQEYMHILRPVCRSRRVRPAAPAGAAAQHIQAGGGRGGGGGRHGQRVGGRFAGAGGVPEVDEDIRPVLAGHFYAVSSLDWYAADHAVFVSGSVDRSVKIWDVEAMTETSVLQFVLPGPVSCVRMPVHEASECLPIAVAFGEPRVSLCDVRSGSASHCLHADGCGNIHVVDWSPTNSYLLATGGVDGRVLLWDIRRAEHSACLLSLDWQQDHTARVHGHTFLRIDQTKASFAKAHSAPVVSVRFAPDGLSLLTADLNDRIYHWDTLGGKRHVTNFVTGDATPAAVPLASSTSSSSSSSSSSSRNMSFLHKPVEWVHGETSRSVRFFYPVRNKLLLFDLHSPSGLPVSKLDGHFGDIVGASFRTTRHHLFTAATDGLVLRWEPETCVLNSDDILEDVQCSNNSRQRQQLLGVGAGTGSEEVGGALLNVDMWDDLDGDEDFEGLEQGAQPAPPRRSGPRSWGEIATRAWGSVGQMSYGTAGGTAAGSGGGGNVDNDGGSRDDNGGGGGDDAHQVGFIPPILR